MSGTTGAKVDEFRAEIRAWFDANAPEKGSAEDFSAIHIVAASTMEQYEDRERNALAVTRRWQRLLHEAGWAGRSWPTEYGGGGFPEWQADVIAEEQARYGVSTKMLAVALEMIPRVLMEYGTPDQCARHLPHIVSGDEAWCQLLSEPDAGSDLTNVQTHAEPAEGGWTLSGQKVWTSGAVSADFGIVLARTDRSQPGRGGVSCFGLDMKQDGVTVRPLRQMSGGYHFNEVFLDGVLVPDDGLIGGLGGGFAVLRTMLASERAAIGGGTSARSATQLRALASELGRASDPMVRQDLAQAYTRERLLDLVGARGDSVTAGGSIAKLMYSEHGRLSANTALELLGPRAALLDDTISEPWIDRFLFAPGLRIGGGTDEIQRNTIAERGLGLPREPRPPTA
jgi:alkylation response protein AidB-like acyl-CoA dehydrogenase